MSFSVTIVSTTVEIHILHILQHNKRQSHLHSSNRCTLPAHLILETQTEHSPSHRRWRTKALGQRLKKDHPRNSRCWRRGRRQNVWGWNIWKWINEKSTEMHCISVLLFCLNNFVKNLFTISFFWCTIWLVYFMHKSFYYMFYFHKSFLNISNYIDFVKKFQYNVPGS
mgnify:CR=1 FL=1